ncbi:FtsX-like permease family protein [Aquisphaera giovannonii]|uniref:FtsX-like permease family protein n=1 Tax=Aquisphaera giovannonii TaxID=406548 RepID=A0A5B9VZ74_9BACT|nr:ABC transporter permease DevC [Aquisphaera giovannonii]QEH33623.1 FtsX-like permease family protein [Aquisphaera giovannonii]
MQPGATIPISWRNLTENRRRLMASLAGTAFAVTLMFMENGFRHAMLDSMVNVIERLDGQVVIVSRTLYTLAVPYNFPYRRLLQAKEFPEVEAASPFYIVTRSGFWRNPADSGLSRITVIGVRLDADDLNLGELKANRDALGEPDTAIADALSRSASFGTFEAGQVSELSGHRLKIVGTFRLGINSQSNGNLIMSERNLLRLFPELAGPTEAENAVTIGLLSLRPGTDAAALVGRLQASLPADVRVLTLGDFIARERDFWDKVAPIGTIFYIGVVMGFIVGCVICYQVLFSDISDRLGEFATLKAMGYSNSRLVRIVVMQGLYLALMGFAAGLAVSIALFAVVHEATGLPMDLSRNNPLAILALTVFMCVASGAFAARRLLSVDPAQLFA